MATNGSVFDACVAATDWLEQRGGRVEIAIICGSGLGGLGEMVTDGQTFPFTSIPNFPQPTVKGHTGSVRVGLLGGVRCAVLQGRLHPYEGYSMEQVVLPVRVVARLGAHTLLVTNAAGGINSAYSVGDIMVIQDHLNLPGFAGLSPLFGANDSRLGVRFPPMADAYDRDLVATVEHIATKQGLPVHRGVYAMVAGPNYETIAEARALHMLGADAVGMSTVPEVLAARHCGVRVVGLSLITNCIPTQYERSTKEAPLGHAHVLDMARQRSEELRTLAVTLAPLLALRENTTEPKQPNSPSTSDVPAEDGEGP
uniref:purine nucleoside phosphorylase-like isoform X1 n=2 Tax=Myxine glutinosa TaxID=7769 RepID=UPI00358FADE8